MAETPIFQLIELVRRRFGVDFGGARLDVLVEHLQRGGPDLNASAARLLSADRQRLSDFVGQLTNTETYFFRHLDHFNALRALVPQAVRSTGATTFRVWSAGCSTGEEPLSLAATLLEVLPPNVSLSVLATDINAAALARAHAGRYTEWSFRGVTPDQRQRYFLSSGGFFKPREALRKAVAFRRHNLLDGPPEPIPFDLVVCRNVLIYFDAVRVEQAVSLLALSVAPGGLLVLGPAESAAARLPEFDPVHRFGCLVHHKRDAGARWQSLAPMLGAAPVAVVLPPPPAPVTAPLAPAPAPRPPPAPGGDGADDLAFARALADQGRLEEARELASRHAARQGDDAEVRLLLALVALEQGQRSHAVAELEAAIARDANLAMAHFLLGTLLEEAAGPAAAEHAFQAALVALRDAEAGASVRASGGIVVSDMVMAIDAALRRARESRR